MTETAKGLAVRPAGYGIRRSIHASVAGLVGAIGIQASSCGTLSSTADDEHTKAASATASTPSVEPTTNLLYPDLLRRDNDVCAAPIACSRANQEDVSFAFAALPPIAFYSRSSRLTVRARLYSQRATIDEEVAQQLDVLLADVRDPKQPKQTHIDRRLLQLLFRCAYHFEVDRIEVVSAYREQRRRREGFHALGRAVDFAIPDVKLEVLASYLRTQARVGVGIYTHRRTRFVHLDVREQSYHWLDGSPPGRTWRGMSIGGTSLVKRDAAYQACDDWPETLRPSAPWHRSSASTLVTSEPDSVPSTGGIGNDPTPFLFESNVLECRSPRRASAEEAASAENATLDEFGVD